MTPDFRPHGQHTGEPTNERTEERAHPRIHKPVQALAVTPHLRDWDAACRSFSWEPARQALAGLPGGALNIAHGALDRHAAGPHGTHVALRWLAADGRGERISYQALQQRCNRFAQALRTAGLSRGDTLALLLPTGPEGAVAVLGALKAGLVVAPLHPRLGPDPLATRLDLGSCCALVTTPALYRERVAPLRARLPALAQVFVLGRDEAVPLNGAGGAGSETPPAAPEGTVDLEPLLREAAPDFDTVPTRPDEPALLHFTSGATGQPKGVQQVHEAALSLWMSGEYALDLHAGDVFWHCDDTGGPGAPGGGLIAPLLHGVTVLLDGADFDPAHCYDVLSRQGVTVWVTTPTVLRRLMRAGPALAARHRFPRLRLVVSTGAPLDPLAVWWGLEVLGQPVHDQWSQAEAGATLIANTVAQDIKPGSLGRPLPGVQACVVLRRPDGGVEVVDTPEAEGELALHSGWPSMFRGYAGEPIRYRRCFAHATEGGPELYLTGDRVRRDAEGCYWFVAAADELILSAGHTVGPFEVEAALMRHPAVAEAVVIGRPDAVAGEIVHAVVNLAPGFAVTEALRLDLLAYARRRLGPLLAPQLIDFASQLPHTADGKPMRRLVRAQFLGVAHGEASGGGSAA